MKNLNVIEQLQRMLEEAQENNPGNEKPFLTFREACDYLQVSSSTLYKLTHQRKIKHLKPNGGKLYFKKSDLLEWMNSKPVKSAEQIDEEAANYVTFK